MTEEGGIGYKQDIPWHYNPKVRKEDLSLFKTVTNGKTIIMGKNTWLSLPIHPLPNRTNIILSATIAPDTVKKYGNNVELHQLDLKDFLSSNVDKEYFLIGGAQLFNYALLHNLVDSAYIYMVSGKHECDASIDMGLFNTFSEIAMLSVDISTEEDNRILLFNKKP